ncbi:MAG: hypothetical protein EKK32_29705 [Bradyrhizobiaceae bacterium]|nr:MAG: hypothetical protein EKK32_29705 [Bradyrhizobiaceae bacterium]
MCSDISYSVMPGPFPGIHVVPSMPKNVVGRDKPGHGDMERDERKTAASKWDQPALGGETISAVAWSPTNRRRSARQVGLAHQELVDRLGA